MGDEAALNLVVNALVVEDARLTDLLDFGSNPGDLSALTYVPKDLPGSAALVVVLHGSCQTARDYNNGSGWSSVADQHKFVLLFPEQRCSNNASLSFNWFAPGDISRDGGEAHSIWQMVEAIVAAHGLDRQRIYITGLSAGGAMASVMLATYPDVFAGGAILAGLAYGCATNGVDAFHRMLGYSQPTDIQLQTNVRGASLHTGPWPTISIWHGSDDQTVHPSNARQIVDQWRGVLEVEVKPTHSYIEDGYQRRVWCDAAGIERMEEFSIAAMGHGIPLDSLGPDGCGVAGAFMLEVGISSTQRIVRFWGLRKA